MLFDEPTWKLFLISFSTILAFKSLTYITQVEQFIQSYAIWVFIGAWLTIAFRTTIAQKLGA